MRSNKSSSASSHGSKQSSHASRHSSHASRHSSCCENYRKLEQINSKTDPHKENIVPLSHVYSNSMIAKTLAKENQLHQSLPDNFNEHLHNLSKCKHDHNISSTAVGCKGYGIPGPTQCSKLKIYRPKTTHDCQRDKNKNLNNNINEFKKNIYSEIDYALCWDLCPQTQHEEHIKRSSHIDGSNGSLAPAVFSLVPSRDTSPCLYENKRDGLHSSESKQNNTEVKCQNNPEKYKNEFDKSKIKKTNEWIENVNNTINPSAVMTIIKKPEQIEKEQYYNYNKNQIINKSRCSSCNSNNTNPRKKSNPDADQMNNIHLDETRIEHIGNKIEEKNDIENKLKQRNCQSSTPNIISHGTISNPDKNQNNIKNEKSNVCPRLQRSRDSSISLNSRKNEFSQPKLKDHSNKKNYKIPTLTPPFTLWPGTTGQDYPEHWRLASVYQHSYKPIEMRKRNLLQCIYQ